MTIDILILRPERDAIEKALSAWASNVVSAISGNPACAIVADVRGDNAIASANISDQISKADVIVYFGHGSVAALGDPVVVGNQEEAALKDKLLVGIACYAGKIFGKELAENSDAEGYLGFDDQLVVYDAYPSIFSAVIEAGLQDLVDPARSGADAANTLRREFLALRHREQAIELDPRYSVQRRTNAGWIWLGANVNEKCVVWHER